MTGESRPLYSLWVTFRSNEHPFQSGYDPYPRDKFATDEEAFAWCRGMREGMGPDYDISLRKNGQPIEVPELPGSAAQENVDDPPSGPIP